MKRIFFYAFLCAPIIISGWALAFFVFATNVPQSLYIGYVRNIYFDCLQFVDEPYVYTAKPGVCNLDNLEYSTTIQSDSYGFRNPSVFETPNIILLGDSHTHGFGVKDNQTFSSILKSYGHRTVNLGIGSYATLRELETLKKFSSGESVVVIQYCDNDYGENVVSLDFEKKEFYKRVKETWMSVASDYQARKDLGVLGIFSGLADLLINKKYVTKKEFNNGYASRNIDEEARVFSKILAKYANILRGKKLIVFESAGWGINHPDLKVPLNTQLILR